MMVPGLVVDDRTDTESRCVKFQGGIGGGGGGVPAGYVERDRHTRVRYDTTAHALQAVEETVLIKEDSEKDLESDGSWDNLIEFVDWSD